MTESTNIKTIKGIGEKTSALFNKVGVFNVYDALNYFPRDYDRFKEPEPITELNGRLTHGEGGLVTVAGKIIGSVRSKRIRNLTIINLSIKGDDGGTLHLTYFNMPYLCKVLKSGNYYIFRGKVEKKGIELHMEQAKMYKEADYEPLIDTLQPRYPLTAGLSNNTVMKTLKQVLSHYTFPVDHLPTQLKEKYQLIDYHEAMEKIHFPHDYEELVAARKRLVFDEFFLFIIAIRRLRDSAQVQESTTVMLEVAETKRLLEKLPYRLTDAQQKVWSEIKIDLSGQYVMNRLIQGDVG